MTTFFDKKARRPFFEDIPVGGGSPSWSRRNFPTPLAKIVADPLWRLLTKQEQKEIRWTHARKLREHRRG
jgi:hypothetical protein